MIIEFHHNGFNDIVNTWTKAAAGNNAAFEFRRVEIDFSPGSRHLKIWWGLTCLKIGLHVFDLVFIEDMIVCVL